MKLHIKEKLETLGDGYVTAYNTMCVHDSLEFVLYFLKINVLHVLFEVLITVSYMTLVVFYSPVYYIGKDIEMSTFFSRILFTCAIIYSLITIFYLLVILFFSAHYARKGNLSGTNTYSKVIKIGIVGGLFAYVFVGVLTAIRPGLFSGEDIAFETFQRIRIAFSITVFGLAWFVLSMLRFKRINWEDAIKVKNGETYCSYCMKDDTPTDNTINRKTLLYTFASAITQALIIFAIVISFIRALMSIPITELKEFNFYNLTLAVFFGLISTYITVIIKNEYIGRFPGFSVCECANSSKKQKQ